MIEKKSKHKKFKIKINCLKKIYLKIKVNNKI